MWRSIFDSVTGTSHEGSGLPCQDACRVVSLQRAAEEVLIIACSDGAGSASHSEVGSQLACDSIVASSREWIAAGDGDPINRKTIASWYERAQSAVVAEAARREVPARELACTLLVAVVGKDWATFAQLGDGAIVIEPPEDYTVVFWPQSGEYANTTNFLTGEGLLANLEVVERQSEVSSIAVFTDGLERLILRFQERVVHTPFLRPMFSKLRQEDEMDRLFPQLRSFLESPAVNERTDDDKTLVLAVRDSGSASCNS